MSESEKSLEKPKCPKCGSGFVTYRGKDNTCGCRVCGHRWKKVD